MQFLDYHNVELQFEIPTYVAFHTLQFIFNSYIINLFLMVVSPSILDVDPKKKYIMGDLTKKY